MGGRSSRVGYLYLAIALLLLLGTGISTYMARDAFERSASQAVLTRQVVDTIDNLLSSMVDAETGQRGFLLTGRERYLEPYQRAVTGIPALFDRLMRLEESIGQNELKPIQQLRSLGKAKLDELSETIELRRRSGLDAALPVVLSGRGKAIMDQIRAV